MEVPSHASYPEAGLVRVLDTVALWPSWPFRTVPSSWLMPIATRVLLLPAPRVPEKPPGTLFAITAATPPPDFTLLTLVLKSMVPRSQRTTLPDQAPTESHRPPNTSAPLAVPRDANSI